MSIEENKAVMQRIWKEILVEGKIEKADELVANDYAYHGPGGHEIRGIEGFKKFISWIHDSFPGIHFIVDDLIAEGDKVVSFFTMQGADKRNKQFKVQGIVICRIVNGKEVEVWEVIDLFTLASQLAPGLVKPMLSFVEKQMVKGRP